MADNLVLNAGSGGATIATDDDGTAHHQLVKVEWGANNTQTVVAAGASALPVQDGGNSITVDNGGTFAVQAAQSGTWNVTNVSGTVSLPTGASTAAKQPALGTAGTASTDVISVQGIASMTPIAVSDNSGSLTVDNGGTFAVQAAQSGTWNITNVSGTVSLPTGAATAAKQPALGTAGTASTDVLSVQGIASMTALKVDGSAVTHPVSMATNTPVGNVAHDGGDSGAPIKIGYKAETSPKGITLVSDGDRADAYCDADGLLMVKLNTSGADVVSEAVSNTDGASTAFTNFSAVASTKNYITGYTVFRTDAGTSVAYVDFRDGTAGSVLWRAPLPPNGGSVSPPCSTPALFKTSANTALAFDVSSALSTVYISVTGYQSKV